MTTLADLAAGEEFLFACQVTSNDPAAGMGLALYGPGRQQAGTAAISAAGVMSGQLAAALSQVPVTTVTGFAPVGAGDVLQNDQTGETMVCRWAQIGADGSVTWSASAARQVTYPARGWTVIGHVAL